MNNKSKGKVYLTVVAMASLLVIAFSVNTNPMNVNAIDFGLISKDTNIGSIDTDSLFYCVGAAITCDNDNTVNNNVAINNGTNDGNDGGDTPLPSIDSTLCRECITNLPASQQTGLLAALGLVPPVSGTVVCNAIDALGTVEALVLVLEEAGLSAIAIVGFLDCLGIDITLAEVEAIIGV